MEAAKQQLLQAARAEFLRNGYKKTSVADIAAAAGIAVGSVYKYYPSKQQLFFDVYFAENDRVKQQAITQINWSEPRTAMLQVMEFLTAETQHNNILEAWDDPKLLSALRAESAKRCGTSEFRTFLGQQAKRWQAAGLLPDAHTPEILEELLEASNQIALSVDTRPEIKRFIYEAVVEKAFPIRGGGVEG